MKADNEQSMLNTISLLDNDVGRLAVEIEKLETMNKKLKAIYNSAVSDVSRAPEGQYARMSADTMDLIRQYQDDEKKVER